MSYNLLGFKSLRVHHLRIDEIITFVEMDGIFYLSIGKTDTGKLGHFLFFFSFFCFSFKTITLIPHISDYVARFSALERVDVSGCGFLVLDFPCIVANLQDISVLCWTNVCQTA